MSRFLKFNIFLVVIVFSQTLFAKFNFKIVEPGVLKQMGSLERNYYKNKVGEIFLNFELIRNRKNKFAASDVLNSIFYKKAYAESRRYSCSIGDQRVHLEGGCKVRSSQYFNCDKNSKSTTWQCGAGYGNLCVPFKKFDISQACYENAMKKGVINPIALAKELENHCNLGRNKDGCHYAQKAMDRVGELVKNNLFYNDKISFCEESAGADSAKNQGKCQVCWIAVGRKHCSKEFLEKKKGDFLTDLLNLGIVSTKGITKGGTYRIRPIIDRACLAKRSGNPRDEELEKKKELFDKKMAAFGGIDCPGTEPYRERSVTE